MTDDDTDVLLEDHGRITAVAVVGSNVIYDSYYPLCGSASELCVEDLPENPTIFDPYPERGSIVIRTDTSNAVTSVRDEPKHRSTGN